jgi:hypothetical protein
MDTVKGVFIVKPCSLDCEYYLYAVEETRRQGKPVLNQVLGEGRQAG